jgi:hypothetical protein
MNSKTVAEIERLRRELRTTPAQPPTTSTQEVSPHNIPPKRGYTQPIPPEPGTRLSAVRQTVRSREHSQRPYRLRALLARTLGHPRRLVVAAVLHTTGGVLATVGCGSGGLGSLGSGLDSDKMHDLDKISDDVEGPPSTRAVRLLWQSVRRVRLSLAPPRTRPRPQRRGARIDQPAWIERKQTWHCS